MIQERSGIVLKSVIIRFAWDWLERHGYDMQHRLEPYQKESKEQFYVAEQAARQRYEALDQQFKLSLPAMLEAKYEKKAVLGKVRVYDAIAELARVINPLEPELGCVSQLTHELQLSSAMERDGLDEVLVLCGLIHDLGTILLSTDEDPINVEAGGKKAPLSGTPGGGLFNCAFRWDHGDFVYLRLKDYVPLELSWLLRHHSMELEACEPYMDERDREYTRRLFVPFAHYDARKDIYSVPTKRLEDYRDLLDRAFPDPILI
jgi:hypothetical protein